MFFLQTVRKKKYTLGAKWGRELQGKNSFVTATNLWTKKKLLPQPKISLQQPNVLLTELNILLL